VTNLTPTFLRQMDRTSGKAVEMLDPTPIVGHWWNTNPRTWGLRETEIRLDNRAVAMAAVAAASADSDRDWGQVQVERMFTDGPASDRVCGYLATFDLGHARTSLQANMVYGLTIITALTTFTDQSGRLSYMTREYFHRVEPELRPTWDARPPSDNDGGQGPAAARIDDRLPMLLATDIDPSPLLYTWRNADALSEGISEISCSRGDGGLLVRVAGVGPDGPIDWGETVATLYTDISATGGGRAACDAGTPHHADLSATDAGPSFLAVYDHGFMRVHLQARLNLGLLVVAMFNEFHDDSGRADYYHREVFVRHPAR
jgi:hypothetical protein